MVRISVGSLGSPTPASFSARTWNCTSVPSSTSVTLNWDCLSGVLQHFSQRDPSFSFFSMTGVTVYFSSFTVVSTACQALRRTSLFSTT
ncbi:hypothetical protein F7725_002692 [Dissostichus mawsoni]|uniref:Uncharacterized protein n=1 Tax=Dissostichus mawsoni TaxID=36200 RepID=A0A7J5Y418_DISMA|nr:hypothetical protein F7725_002692 [Dissostichus mawsoni]